MDLNDDLQHLAAALGPIAERSRDLPWAKERAWTPRTHLGTAGGLPAIDLHDLSVRLALETLETACRAQPSTGGVVLITGRGRHSGGRSRLREAVRSQLEGLQESGELVFHTPAPGRFEVVFDRERVRASRPGMGLLFWLFAALLMLAVLATLWGAVR